MGTICQTGNTSAVEQYGEAYKRWNELKAAVHERARVMDQLVKALLDDPISVSINAMNDQAGLRRLTLDGRRSVGGFSRNDYFSWDEIGQKLSELGKAEKIVKDCYNNLSEVERGLIDRANR